MLHVFSLSGLFSAPVIEEATDNSSSFIAKESYLQPQVVNETAISEIAFAPFAQEVHVDLALHSSSSDTSSGYQETSVMQEGTGFDCLLSRASSKY